MGIAVLDRKSALPLYQQLREQLEARIRSGLWKPGDQIPTEDELCRMYQVSRSTVKQAIGELVQAGLLYRWQGKGTFVAKPRIRHRLALTSFTQDMVSRGLKPASRILGLEMIGASEAVASSLNVPVDSLVWRLDRLRLADGEPMGRQTAYLPVHLCPEIPADAVEKGSLYEFLDKRYGLRSVRAIETYIPTVASAADAALLGVSPGTPLFAVERLSFLADNRVLEYVQSLLRGDRYTLYVELSS